MSKKEEWQALREQGLTFEDIAKKYDTSKQLVWQTLDIAGAPRKTKHSAHYQDWENLYNQGISIPDIAKKYNCSTSTVHNYLKKKVSMDASKSALKAWKKKKKNGRKKKEIE
jgi:predicted DNA-binding protein YlxM (UPF0122 family)